METLYNVVKLFFYVSGEHVALPYSEIKAILESEGFEYKNVEIFPKLLCLEASPACIPSVNRRSSYVKICGIEIFRSKVEEDEIIHYAKEVKYDKYIGENQTFSVRIKRLVKTSVINVVKLEMTLGQIILKRNKNLKVKLKSPHKPFFGLLLRNFFIYGLKIIEKNQKAVQKRCLKNRPFFHPSAMSPKLARCMVNLARCKPKGRVMDPFCGTGSLLIEAGLLGYEVIGSDLDPKMVKGSHRNLQHYKIFSIHMIVSDARYLPFKSVDCIVTDPPYGRVSSTFGKNMESLVSEFLKSTVYVLKEKGFIVISTPDQTNIVELCEGVGYKIVEEHFIREHKSLTRKITIIQKISN